MKDDVIIRGIQGIISAKWYRDKTINDVSVTYEGAKMILDHVRRCDAAKEEVISKVDTSAASD